MSRLWSRETRDMGLRELWAKRKYNEILSRLWENEGERTYKNYLGLQLWTGKNNDKILSGMWTGKTRK